MINEQELMQSIDNFLSENKEAMLADLKTLIGQPSVRGEAAPGAPYGTDVNAALEKALAIARRMGLEAENCAAVSAFRCGNPWETRRAAFERSLKNGRARKNPGCPRSPSYSDRS